MCTSSLTPQQRLFPGGLRTLAPRFGGGLMLYMVNFCANNTYVAPAEAAASFTDPAGRHFVTPRGDASEAVYGRVLDDGLRQGMTNFEIDFMSQNFAFVPHYRTDAGAADAWLTGLSRAAAARGVSMQLCTATARDAVATAALPAVTQMRASVDFACWCGGEPASGNWDIGGQALLLSALRLGASKDTLFTADAQPGIGHVQCGKCPVPTRHAELDVFIATLSRGPVGAGDGVAPGGNLTTNRSLLMRCCAESGRILSPGTGIAPIDATWARGAPRRR